MGLQRRTDKSGHSDPAEPPEEFAGYRLRLNPATAPIRLVSDPQVTMLMLLTTPRVGRGARAPAVMRRRALSELSPGTRAALRPYADPTRSCRPGSLTRLEVAGDVPVSQQADRMRDTPTDVIAGELVEAYGEHPPPVWRPAMERPRPWLHAIADGCVRAWSTTRSLWRDSRDLLDREARRVGAAVVLGQTGTLLNNLHPRLRYADGVLTFDAPTDLSFDLGDRRIGLIPMLGGPDMLNVTFATPEDVAIGYPLPGGRLPGYPAGQRPPEEDPLSLLLGPLRARMLRRLAHPCTVGELGVAVQCAPNTASYHCDRLEVGGLVRRERHGKSVRVLRTERGDEVVDLLAG